MMPYKIENPLKESYDIVTDDQELHAINVMLEVLRRHVDRSEDVKNCEENIMQGKQAMVRCAKYVLERVSCL